MTDLTRDEIRRACEAAGWPKPGSDDEYHIDPMALLEAVGRPFMLHHVPGRKDSWWVAWEVSWPSTTKWLGGITLRAAAVRAVNAWSKR